MPNFSDFNMGVYLAGLGGEKPAYPLTYAELESLAKEKLDAVLAPDSIRGTTPHRSNAVTLPRCVPSSPAAPAT